MSAALAHEHDRDGDDDDTPTVPCVCGCGATFRAVTMGRRVEVVGECLRSIRQRHIDGPVRTAVCDRAEPARRAAKPRSRRACVLAVLRPGEEVRPLDLAGRLGWSRRDALDALKYSLRIGDVERVEVGVYRLVGGE